MTGPEEDAVSDVLGAILSRRIDLALAVLRGIQNGDPVQRGLQVAVDIILTGEIE